MITKRIVILPRVAICLLSVQLVPPAQAAKFLGLGDLPGGAVGSSARGISANGSVVVGDSTSGSGVNEAFRWTSGGGMLGLGDLTGGPFLSHATGVSADGTVVVGDGLSTSGTEAFLWTSSGGMIGLGDLPGGGFQSFAHGVSADGSIVVGYGATAAGFEAFRWTSGSGMVGLGDLPGGAVSSVGRAISANGSVMVGESNSASGANEAFRWTSSGGMVGLGDLTGGSFSSFAFAASADGSVVVGLGDSALGLEAFRWTSGGGMVGLGDLAGGAFSSRSIAVSADGSVIVGQGTTTSGNEAIIWDAVNGMRNLKSVLLPSVGAALNGWTLTFATGISADGRTVVGQGINPSGVGEAWLAYLPAFITWFPEASGSWDSSLSWSGPFLPGPTDAVSIDPPATVTVTGPSSNTVISDLTIGGDGSNRATLRLDGATAGDIKVTFVLGIQSDGELVLANGRSISAQSQVINTGVIRGSGTFEAPLQNSGEVRVAAGESLLVIGTTPFHSNFGKIEAIGGSMEFAGALTNNANVGLITGGNATYRFRNGLTNNGSLMLSFGTNNVSGDITNSGTGKIVVAGGAAATFYDDVTQNGTLQVIKVGSTNSVAVFAGAFIGSGGSSGGGDIFFLGDLRPGNSPASVTFGNNVAFASSATLSVEIGGTNQGTGYDHLNITGDLALDGVLEVALINGFIPSAGQSFNILDWGTLTGSFAAINLPSLAGLTWNTSALYTTGALSVGQPGDFNANGVVDAADYVVWRKRNGSQAEYNTWRSNFGLPAGSGSGSAAGVQAAVPEPAAFVILMFAAAGSCLRRLRTA
jgi:probable HAF family extracellular repeat protein